MTTVKQVADRSEAKPCEAGRLRMSTENLSDLVLSVFNGKDEPLTLRRIEALVVLQNEDVSTYQVQRAVSRLVEQGVLMEDDSYRYRKVGSTTHK
jgi:hypothetical protein